MSKWEKLRVSDLGLVVTGKTPSTSKPEFYGNETPFLTPRDMDWRRIIDRTERYLSVELVRAIALSFLLFPFGRV